MSKSDKFKEFLKSNNKTCGGGCPLCELEVKKELDFLEKNLKENNARVPITAIFKWLKEEGLVNHSIKTFTVHFKNKCHSDFYKYLKGLTSG